MGSVIDISELCFYLVPEYRGQGFFLQLLLQYERLLQENRYYQENYFQVSFRSDNEDVLKHKSKLIEKIHFSQTDKREELVYKIETGPKLRSCKEKIFCLRRQIKLKKQKVD